MMTFNEWWQKNKEIIDWHIVTAGEVARLRIIFESAWSDGYLQGRVKAGTERKRGES